MNKILQKQIKVNADKCFGCGNSVKISYELTSVDGPEGWSDVSFYAPIVDCSYCEKKIFAPEYQIIENEAMCIAAGVLTPDEIKAIRKKIDWGKNNVTFSQILGFGSSTIARYESGSSIPSKAHNRILKLLKYPDVLKDFEESEEYHKFFKVKKSKNINKEVSFTDGNIIYHGFGNVAALPTAEQEKIKKQSTNQNIIKRAI